MSAWPRHCAGEAATCVTKPGRKPKGVGALPVVACLGLLPWAAAASADEWQFSVLPYLWLPSIEGQLKYSLPPGSGGDPSVGVGPINWLELINFGFLVNATARKGRFSIASDLVYLSLSSDGDSRLLSLEATIPGPGGVVKIPVAADLNVSNQTDLDGLQWSVVLGYALLDREGAVVDLIAGARYFSVDLETTWNLSAEVTVPGGTEVFPASGTVGASDSLWDVVVGVRGRWSVGESRWSVPYYLDAGTGDSDLTLNASIGLLYDFSWGGAGLFYRHLEYDQSDDDLLQNFSFSGPALGVRLTF